MEKPSRSGPTTKKRKTPRKSSFYELSLRRNKNISRRRQLGERQEYLEGAVFPCQHHARRDSLRAKLICNIVQLRQYTSITIRPHLQDVKGSKKTTVVPRCEGKGTSASPVQHSKGVIQWDERNITVKPEKRVSLTSTVSNLPKSIVKLMKETGIGKLDRTLELDKDKDTQTTTIHDVTSQQNKSPNQIRRAQKSTTSPPRIIEPIQRNSDSILAQPKKKAKKTLLSVYYPD
ncbi:hypothetical protein B9Z55_011586 [Caenorhabditis nigoni]|uniref:Uncharacterized protein n=1 Tax=Caenorhabditis nigoni TaxID=1611254 RepID=A0A2G5UKR7_9PELO|nr:hypothetical protein B9Z55_011586 [Caenorhabditis nigoni]